MTINFDLLGESCGDLVLDAGILLGRFNQNLPNEELRIQSVIAKCNGFLSIIFCLCTFSYVFTASSFLGSLFYLTSNVVCLVFGHDCLILGHNIRMPIKIIDKGWENIFSAMPDAFSFSSAAMGEKLSGIPMKLNNTLAFGPLYRKYLAFQKKVWVLKESS